jgi:hypothetical protein
MTVIDLIIKLQQLPPNMEVMVDHTREEGTMFKFVELNYCDEVTTATDQKIILLSPYEYVSEED